MRSKLEVPWLESKIGGPSWKTRLRTRLHWFFGVILAADLHKSIFQFLDEQKKEQDPRCIQK